MDLSRLIPPFQELLKRVSRRIGQQIKLCSSLVVQAAREELAAPPRARIRGGVGIDLPQDGIARIVSNVQDLGDAIAWEQFGVKPEGRGVLQKLVAKGYLKSAAGYQFPLAATAFELGRVGEIIYSAKSIKEALAMSEALPQSREERIAAELLANQGGFYAKGLARRMEERIEHALHNRNREIGPIIGVSAEPSLDELRELMPDAARRSEGWKRLSQRIQSEFGDRRRDWDRFAYSELHESANLGRALDIALTEPEGVETLVHRIPRPGACKYCKELFMNPDGTLKTFRIGELISAGSNAERVGWLGAGRSSGGSRKLVKGDRVGEEVEEYEAVAGNVHPYCGCPIVVASRPIHGYDFPGNPEMKAHFENIYNGITVKGLDS